MQRKVVLTTVAIVAVLAFLVAVPGTSFYTDLLWYRDAGYASVFTRQVATQSVLFVVAGAFFIVLAGVNVVLARRLTPLRPLAITNDFLFNLRRSLDPVIRWVQLGVIGALAFAFASATLPIWQQWLMFGHAQSFGVKDPVFNKDVGFYVFKLPIWEFAAGWLFWALLITVLLVAAVYAYAGAIGPQPEGGYLAPQPRVHLSILLGFVLLVKAWMYLMDQWELLFAPGGFVQGAKYTEVNAQLPAFRVLFWIAILAALLMFATFATKRLVLPVVAIALMAVAALIVGGAYPVLVQTFKVQPNANSLQQPYVERGITFTRQAYGLDKVVTKPFPATNDLTGDDLLRNVAPLRNVRLWDDAPLLQNLKQTQEIASYYSFTGLPGVDRYDIGGQPTQVLVNARNVFPQQLDQKLRTWQNIHLVYTHGLGAVVAQSNQTTETGDPSLLVKDVPPRNTSGAASLDISEPRLYFGDTTALQVLPTEDGVVGGVPDVGDDFVIVDTKVAEADGPAGGGTQEYRYSGATGIRLDSFVKKAAFAIRFGDAKFLLSSAITDKSRLMYARDVEARVKRLAPFLTFDRSPYLTLLGGKMVWVVDAYTTTPLYPYSQPVDGTADPSLAALDGTTYIRNSVKVTLDAFSGEATFYRVDMNDPIAAAWAKVFPKQFKNADAVPAELRRHFRTPIDQFSAQLQIWSKFHADAAKFIEGAQVRSVAQQSVANGRQTTGTGDGQTVPLRPQYFQTVLPGTSGSEFVLFNSMTPLGKPNLVSLMFARSDPENFGQIVQYELPTDNNINGPQQVQALIAADQTLSQKQSLLSQGNSRLDFGQIRIVPIDRSLLYIQPWYVSATGAGGRPELKVIALVYGQRVTSGTTFSEALLAMFGFTPLDQAAPTGEAPAPAVGGQTGNQAPPQVPPAGVKALADQAQSVYNQMQDALKAGDLAKYGQLEKQLGTLISQIQASSESATPPTTAAAAAK